MTSNRFADLLRALAERPSRRGVGRALAGLALSGALGRLSPAEADAKRKKKRKKQKCKGGTKKCGKKCVDLQTDPLHCGSCGNGCDVNRECIGGNCACSEGEKECGESCIPQGECCSDADCENGEACVDGTCICPAENAVCDGICVDLATDGANCGACGNTCDTGGCIHGACTCGGASDCPEACICGPRSEGAPNGCRSPGIGADCDVDTECPLGSICLSSDICSIPCQA